MQKSFHVGPLNLRSSFMLCHAFAFELKPFENGFMNVAYKAGVPTKELYLRTTTLEHVKIGKRLTVDGQ